MAIKMSDAVANAMLNTIETTIGASAVLKLRTGAPPATVATADSGDVVATLDLPADWLANAAARAKAKAGTWQDASADAAGTVGHFRIYASNGTTAHLQGTVTLTAGGGDLTLDDITVVEGQAITITAFSIAMGN